jgi:hypothetical protein
MTEVDYKNFLTVPADYKCMECSATGCKLWREYQTFVPDILCARCAAKRGKKDISDMDSEGLHSSKMVCDSRRTIQELTLTARYDNAKFSAGASRLPRKLKKRLKKDFDRGYELVSSEMDMGRSDQIGWFVPAVPTEDGDTYWGLHVSARRRLYLVAQTAHVP